MDEISAKLIERNRLSERTFEIKLTKSDSFTFIPGQRIRVIHEGLEREYSLISIPDNSYLQLCVRRVDKGKLSPILSKAKLGTRLMFKGPYGYFTFKPSLRSAVFVATGTGAAPFISMAAAADIKFTMIQGAPKNEDLYYQAFFRSRAAHYAPCLSREEPSPGLPSDVFYGRVTEYLEERLKPGAYDFYLCGGAAMVRDATHIVDERFPGSLVHTEVFK